ncbi:MAG TPA: hypothetical protein VK821_01220, partial [Dehalococcoidia bacterium]|nr:hypothetical protein [Dehalococcoidia bacterium]
MTERRNDERPGWRGAKQLTLLPDGEAPEEFDSSPSGSTLNPWEALPVRLGNATIASVDSRSILTPASGFAKRYKFTLNPYGGCGFGCEYCYARFFAPSSDLQDTWGSWVTVKRNAIRLIKQAQTARSVAGRLETDDAVYMSTVTDPYQPIEMQAHLTRAIL